MRRISILIAAGLCVGLFRLHTPAQAAAEMSLTRLDCGTPQAPISVNQRFSDTFSFNSFTAAISSSTATNTCCGILVIP